jgi:hypothetical protein
VFRSQFLSLVLIQFKRKIHIMPMADSSILEDFTFRGSFWKKKLNNSDRTHVFIGLTVFY